jgi:hypothetical protein
LTWLTDHHELNTGSCTTAGFTAGDTVTVSTSDNSRTVTVPINDGAGAAPAGNTLDSVTAVWKTNGNGSLTAGKLFIEARVSDNNQLTASYSADYDQNASDVSAALTWNAGGSYWMENANFEGVPSLGTVRVWAASNGDDKNYVVTPDNDSVSTYYAHYDGNAAGGTLTVRATHSYNDGSLTYKVTYNGSDYTMAWTGGTHYELVQTGLGLTMAAATVDVWSNEAGEYGGDIDSGYSITDDTVIDDVIAITGATWINDGNGQSTGTLDVTATNNGGDNGCAYVVNYNGSFASMSWQSGTTWTGQITTVDYDGSTSAVYIGGLSSPCDTTANYYAPVVTNNSDVLESVSGVHDDTDLTVTATVTSGSCTGKTYYADYPDGTQAPSAMTCTGGTGLSYTWTAAPAYVALQEVTVHSADTGGAKVSGSVTYNPPGDPELLPKHYLHEESRYVTWGSKAYSIGGGDSFDQAIVSGESCFNCHGPHDGTLDTVMDVHNAKCDLCHTTPDASSPTPLRSAADRNKDLNQPDGSGQDGFITEAGDGLSKRNGGAGPGYTCTSCHHAYMSQKDIDPGPGENWQNLRFKTWNHHLSENAQQGNCVNCHDLVRKTPVGSSWCLVAGSRVPRQPPCAYCHVDAERAFNGDGAWQLQFFDFATDGFNTPLTKLTSSTHSIPNVDGIPGDNRPAAGAVFIHDYAVCFDCHDKSATSEGDMQETMLDGLGASVLGQAAVPNKVYPYHASGMSLDLSGASRTELDPGGNTWFPIDKTRGGYDANAECAKEGTTCGSDGPIYDNVTPISTTGPTGRNDLFMAYQYHPGRGGIVGTSDVIGGVSNQQGSFNILFPLMTPYLEKNSKYYFDGGAASGNTFKHAYEADAINPNYNSTNFGVGGSATPTYTPNTYYLDSYGREWDFSGVHNVPYTDYKIDPQAVDNTGDVYWTTVPVFPDLSGDKIPSIADAVRLLSVDCQTKTVKARSVLTGDYNFNQTPTTGDLKVKTNIQTTEVNMTYDTPTDTWTGTLGADCTGEDVTVTSYISGGGTAFFDQTP